MLLGLSSIQMFIWIICKDTSYELQSFKYRIFLKGPQSLGYFTWQMFLFQSIIKVYRLASRCYFQGESGSFSFETQLKGSYFLKSVVKWNCKVPTWPVKLFFLAMIIPSVYSGCEEINCWCATNVKDDTIHSPHATQKYVPKYIWSLYEAWVLWVGQIIEISSKSTTFSGMHSH